MGAAAPQIRAIGDGLALALLVVLAIPIAMIDIRCRRIPDAIVLPAIAAALLLRGWWGAGWLWPASWSAATAALLLVPSLIRPEGMGLGDVKLAGLLGAVLGVLAPAGVLLALVTGAIGGSVAALVRGRPVRGATIPFGPFLLAASLVVALPVVFLHSQRAVVRTHHTHRSSAPVRPARIGLGRVGGNAPVGWPGAAVGARNHGRAGPGGGDTAPRR
jgi:leader peptidase (prepilin peptidase)/N-methyltransferase